MIAQATLSPQVANFGGGLIPPLNQLSGVRCTREPESRLREQGGSDGTVGGTKPECSPSVCAVGSEPGATQGNCACRRAREMDEPGTLRQRSNVPEAFRPGAGIPFT